MIDFDILNLFINKAASDFFELFLALILNEYDKDRKAVKKHKDKVSKWNAEKTKLNYYKTKWDELVIKGNAQKEDTLFFIGVMEEIDDVTKSARNHKKAHANITRILCILPVFITIFTAAATAIPEIAENTVPGKWVIYALGIVATLSSAILAAVNNHDEKTSHKETWLRQRLYYSMLMSEMENFSERLNSYTGLSDDEAISLFMKNIGNLRKKDYENFFTNMGCSNFEK